ncbi:MAG: DUF6020 family protein [Lachnospiraceae bacterium]|nr:DUF6020 family protein [Lachnospiraceae bacterium]
MESIVQRRVEDGLSVVFTVFFVFGDFEQIYAGLDNGLFRLMVLAVTTMGLFIIFQKAISLIFIKTVTWNAVDAKWISTSGEDVPASHPENYEKGVAWKGWNSMAVSTISAMVCFICWIPYLLKNFPGVMTIDSMNQFAQVIGVYAPSNHHPWMHTLVMRLFYNIGYFLTGDRTSAIAYYTVFQVIFMAACIAYLLNTLLKLNLSKWALILVTAFYALVPYNALYAVTVWKDSMFAGGVMLYVCTLLRLLLWVPTYHGDKDKTIKRSGKRIQISRALDWTMLVVSALLMSLFRTNGWYAFLVTIPFVIYVFRSCWKVILGLQILIIVAVMLIKGPFMEAQHVIQPDLVESLSIPIQQISRVIVEERPLTKEQNTFLNQILDTSKIAELYNPYVSDGFKRLVRAGDESYLEEHFGEFLKIYIQIGMKYPGDYVVAFRDQSIGYWFPTQGGIIAGDEGVIPNEFGVENRPVLKGPIVIKLNEIALKLKDILPGYGILWSMGALLWLILLAAAIIIVRGDRRRVLLYIPCIAIVLTLIIATPVAKEFRYAYAYIFCLPLYLLMPFMREN